jgi:phosphohistidine phosphatase SixA
MMKLVKRSYGLVLAMLLLPAAAWGNDETAWAALKSGQHVVLIRHAQTEAGVGDPEGFVLGNCATQRNLAASGRADAALIGKAFRDRKIAIDKVLSSRWCRCLDTARIAFGEITPSVMLDSLFNVPGKLADEKISEVHAYMKTWKAPGNLVMVTHDVNIRLLTGQSVGSGEMVVTRYEAGQFKVVQRINVPRS